MERISESAINEFSQKVSLLAEKSELVFERLAALALFGGFDELQFLGEIGRDFVFEDFRQSNVGHTQPDGIADQGTAQGAAAGVQLAHATRHQVDEHVRVADFRQRFPAEFAIHNSIRAAYTNALEAERNRENRKFHVILWRGKVGIAAKRGKPDWSRLTSAATDADGDGAPSLPLFAAEAKEAGVRGCREFMWADGIG